MANTFLVDDDHSQDAECFKSDDNSLMGEHPRIARAPRERVISALFSDCRNFRYLLAREWDKSLPTLGYVGLNPSIAAEAVEDSTSRKFRGFAERLGYGSYVTTNLFAFVSTSPSALKAAGYPVGPDNDAHLSRALADLDVVCAWGSNAAGLGRSRDVVDLLRRINAKTYALRVNADGTPAHPLYLPYTCTLVPFGGKR